MTLFLDRRELLARFRAGERRALEETYRFYAPAVAAFLSRGFKLQPFDLDNALAETFVRAFAEQSRLRYDGIHPYKNYLFTIARNLVIDQMRGREVAMNEPIEALIDDEEPNAEEDLIAKELAQLCDRFVGNLADRDRLFFKARFEEARTQVEAGKSAGLSHMQARSLEKKLRKRLLGFLKSSGYLEGYGPQEAR